MTRRVRYRRRNCGKARWTWGLGTVAKELPYGDLVVDSDAGFEVVLVAGDDEWEDVDLMSWRART